MRPPRLRALRPVRVAIAAAALVVATAAAAQSAAGLRAPPTLGELRAAYLECDRRSSHEVLDLASAVHCSIVSEQLLQRAFDGDLDRLLAWWRSERTSQGPVATQLH